MPTPVAESQLSTVPPTPIENAVEEEDQSVMETAQLEDMDQEDEYAQQQQQAYAAELEDQDSVEDLYGEY